MTVLGSVTSFSTATGTASEYQLVRVSGQNLLDDITIMATDGGLEFSTDNVNYSTPKTVFRIGSTLPGQPTFIYVRVPASAAVGPYTGNITFSSAGANPVLLPYSVTVNAAVTIEKYSFGKDNTMNTTPGWTLVYGNPSMTDIAVAGISTGWIIQVNHLNWLPFAGNNYASNTFGANAGTFGSEFPASVIAGSFLSNGVLFNAASPNYGLHIDNLPTGTYKIRLIGSIQSTVLNTLTTPYYYIGTPTDGNVEHHTMNMQDNTGTPNDNAHILEWTVHIIAGDILGLGVYAGPGFSPGGGGISGLTIQKL
jgi:hypothetical protein